MELRTFLNALKETIITLQPCTNNWSGLDGAWYKQYIYHINKIRKGFVLQQNLLNSQKALSVSRVASGL